MREITCRAPGNCTAFRSSHRLITSTFSKPKPAEISHQHTLFFQLISHPLSLSLVYCLLTLTCDCCARPKKKKRGQRFVLRKKPAGALLSSTAHAVEREYRI